MNIQEAAKIINVQPKDIRRMARKYFSTHKEEGKNWDLTLQQVVFIGSLFAGQKNKRPKPPTVVQVPKPEPQSDQITELTKFATKWIHDTYGITLEIPILTNNRLTRALGRFRYRSNGQSVSIELAGDLLKYYPQEEIIDVLKHELVHYACFSQGKPYLDGSPHFESELVRLGVTGTNILPARGIRHGYKCTACNKDSTSRRKLKNISRYHSGCCKEPLKYVGEVEVNLK